MRNKHNSTVPAPKCTKLFQMNRPPSIPFEYQWITSSGKTKHELKKYLCDDGQKTDGAMCKTCESPCAFGKSYISDKPESEKVIVVKLKKVPRRCQAFKLDGTIINDWDTIVHAAKAVGLKNDSNICRAMGTSRTAAGYYWRWVLQEEEVSS